MCHSDQIIHGPLPFVANRRQFLPDWLDILRAPPDARVSATDLALQCEIIITRLAQSGRDGNLIDVAAPPFAPLRDSLTKGRGARRQAGGRPHPGSDEEPARQPGRARDVLLIDDDETSRYVVRQMLSGWRQLSIREAKAGAEGLRLARSGRPDVALPDLRLPKAALTRQGVQYAQAAVWRGETTIDVPRMAE